MSEPVRKLGNYALEVEGFLKTLFEGQEGYVYAPTKNPQTGYWQPYFFKFPTQRENIVIHVMDATRSKEVYLSPSLFSSPDAHRSNWKGSNFVWTEFDGNAPEKLPKGIPSPSIKIQSSTKGHEHWYWRLKEFETNADIVQGLSKRLTYTLKADKSAWDSNQVLRPPGTLHHDSKHRVRALSRSESTFSLSDFSGLVEAPPDVIINTSYDELPDVQDVISKYKFSTDARDLFKKATQPTGARSSAMTRMAFHCVEMGMTNEEAYSILLNCDERWGKYKQRTPESRVKVLTGMIAHVRNEKAVQAEQKLTEYEPMYTISELLALDFSKLNWVYSEVISETSTTIIAGDPNVGKSTLAFQMGLSVALGKGFLGWAYKCPEPLNVGLFSYEMDARQSGHFIGDMIKGYSELDQLILKSDRVRVRPTGYAIPLYREEEQQKILDYVDQYDLKFLVIDSLKAISGLQENRYDAIQRFLDKDLRGERGCTIVLIHHNRKPPQEGRTAEQSLADLYGDVFIQAGATSVLGLRVKQNGIEIANVKNRLAPALGTFRVKRTPHMGFVVDLGPGHPKTEGKVKDDNNTDDTAISRKIKL